MLKNSLAEVISAGIRKTAEEASRIDTNKDGKPTPASVSLHYKKKFFGPGMKQTGKTVTVYGGLAPKIAEMNQHLSHGLELGGLGVLAAHPISTLRDPKASKKDKHIAKLEAAGLGVLALPALHHFGSRALKAMRKSASISDWVKANPRKALAAGLITAGGAIGAHDRYDRSTKKPTESESRFRYRRLRNTGAGALKGVATAGSLAAGLAMAEQAINKSAADQMGDDEQGLKSMALMNALRRRPRGALIAGDVNARNGTAVEALQKAMRK